jgi:signal peptidase II
VTRRTGWLRALVVAGAVLGLDQATKAWARSAVERGTREDLLPLVDLVHVRNDGVAFGLGAGATWPVVAVVGVALLALLAYFARHAGQPAQWLPMGLLLGGAVGNVVDRVRDGAVTDFVKLPAWPAFNLADVAITVGVVLLLLLAWHHDAADDRP